jgi:hypothetical protein
MYTSDTAFMSIIDELVAERKRRLQRTKYGFCVPVCSV